MGRGFFTAIAAFVLLLIPALFDGPTVAFGAVSSGNDMLQFTAGGHLLGFARKGAYLVAPDHALAVEFPRAGDVMPKAERDEPSGNSSTRAPLLKKVVYEDLWNGITLTYEPTREGITESAYHVAPGADVSKIRLKYNVPVELQKDGFLRFRFNTGYLTESPPVAWQEINGKRVPVAVNYRIINEEVGFAVGGYDKTVKLVIDPNYEWHSFYGSTNIWAHGIAVDAGGNVYLTGYSTADWYGPGGESPKHDHSGSGDTDIFVLKLNSSGAYQWHTFLGSGGINSAAGIAVEASGNVYVTGRSEYAWDDPQPPVHAHGGSNDIFVLKLNGSGDYQWHTFYGSAGDDSAAGIAVDSSGNAHVVGTSSSTWNGDGSTAPYHSHSGGNDIFVLKLSNSGAYQWHTFYGSSGEDTASGIALSGGYLQVTGTSSAAWNVGSTSPLHGHSGGKDIVVLKLSGSGAYHWHTFYGSAGDDVAAAIAVDSSGNLHVAGTSSAAWNAGATTPLHSHGGGKDAFALKLGSGGAYLWHTFYGSAADDSGTGIALDASGNVHVTGSSPATWSGAGGTGPVHPYGGHEDGFILKLGSDGAYQRHTFKGSTAGDDPPVGIALDGSGGIYVAANSSISWSGDGGQSPVHPFAGYGDVAVLKLNSSCAYQWHTFYGSNDLTVTNVPFDMAVDSGGNIYLAGRSTVAWNGAGGALPIHPYTGYKDIFVLKLNSSGVYQWHSFYGSDYGDSGNGIALDAGGNVYVTGWSEYDWNGDGGKTPLNAFSGNTDLFVLKLDNNGAYQWHSFYGSRSYTDGGMGIAVDANGNIYVTGESYGSWVGPDWQEPIHPHSGSDDIFVLKLDGAGAYQWHTFYGSADNELAASIALDGSANVYVCGYGQATWNGDGGASPKHPFTSGALQAEDIFVLKLDKNGVYQWHTFYGSNQPDFADRITTDSSGNPYVTGGSWATWNGPDEEAPLNPHSGGIYVLKLNSGGAYQWHTFYGGNEYDEARDIALDATGNIFVTGTSTGWNGPGGIPPLHGGGQITVLKLDSGGAYQWHTFYGSDTSNYAMCGAVDGTGNVFSGGESYAESWDGDGGASPLHAYSGYDDIFILKLRGSTGVVAPTVTTAEITAITATSASGGGNVTSDGGGAVTGRGVCWGTSANPTTAGSHTSDGSGTGFFTSSITGLIPHTIYHVRAYAINSGGTAYGDDDYFTSLCPGFAAYVGTTGYGTLLQAVNSTVGTFAIRAVAGVRAEVLNILGYRIITLAGGYDCTGDTVTGMTTVHGSLSVGGSAAVTVSNVAVQ